MDHMWTSDLMLRKTAATGSFQVTWSSAGAVLTASGRAQEKNSGRCIRVTVLVQARADSDLDQAAVGGGGGER